MQGSEVRACLVQRSANYDLWPNPACSLFLCNLSDKDVFIFLNVWKKKKKAAVAYVTETINPIKPKIFTIWPFTGKVCPPLISTICSLSKKKKKEKNNEEALHALIWNDLQYMLLSGKGNVPNYIQYILSV